jgi:hypothetical protein
MDLNPDLLKPDRIQNAHNFRAVTNAHWVYNTLQFVLRHSPKVYQTLSGATPGVIEGAARFDVLQAMSTFLHETVRYLGYERSMNLTISGR